jgi:hypothetical protein
VEIRRQAVVIINIFYITAVPAKEGGKNEIKGNDADNGGDHYSFPRILLEPSEALSRLVHGGQRHGLITAENSFLGGARLLSG